MPTAQQKLNAVRDMYKLFSEADPPPHVWYLIVDRCINLLMQDYITELERAIDDEKVHRPV